MVHLIVKGQLFPCTHIPSSEECNPGETLVKSVDPHRVDNKVGITLRKEADVVSNLLLVPLADRYCTDTKLPIQA